MNHVKIDTATGLPELPEGYFWRVAEYSIHIMEPVSVGPWGDWYRIPKEFTQHLRTAADAKAQGERAYSKGSYEFEGRIINFGFLGGVGFDYRKRRAAHDTDVFSHYFEGGSGYDSWGRVHEDEGRNTKANLRQRAENCYVEWRATIREDQEVADLIGDYPPKKLGGV